MPRGRPKKVQEEEGDEVVDEKGDEEECCEPVSEKERLLALRKQLTDLRVNSVSDLDGLISRAE